MHLKRIVKVSEQTGLAFVEVSHEDMWELVEQLSHQRAAVNYTYHEDYFTVSFLHLDQAAVEKLLDEWNSVACSMDEDATTGAYAEASLTP